MDFLLLIIRKLHTTNSRTVKIILISATNAEKFAEYFSVATEKGFVKAFFISIPKKHNYNLTTHYLDELGMLGMVSHIIKLRIFENFI